MLVEFNCGCTGARHIETIRLPNKGDCHCCLQDYPLSLPNGNLYIILAISKIIKQDVKRWI